MKDRIISADGKTMIEQDAGFGRINVGKGASIISPKTYDAMVEAAGSEDELVASLGVTKSEDMSLPLATIKARCKRKVQKQAESSFAAKYSVFEVCLGIEAGSGKPVYDNMMLAATAYKRALKAAKDAIEEATNADDAIGVMFITPE